MKKMIRNVVLGLLAALALGACSYVGAVDVGSQVVVLRNDHFLFGALRGAYVCNVTPNGLAGCVEGESP
jgi:hypothetical protein